MRRQLKKLGATKRDLKSIRSVNASKLTPEERRKDRLDSIGWMSGARNPDASTAIITGGPQPGDPEFSEWWTENVKPYEDAGIKVLVIPGEGP